MKKNPDFEKAVASLDTILKPEHDNLKRLYDSVAENPSEGMINYFSRHQDLHNNRVIAMSQAVKMIASSLDYTFDNAFKEEYRV